MKPACSFVLLSLLASCGDASRKDSEDVAARSDAAVDTVRNADAAVARLPDAASARADAASAPGDASTRGDAAQAAGPRLPPTNGGLDYQLGGAYPPASGVTIVSRDRHEAPAKGLYNLCYVNGFQAQTEDEDFWLEQQPDLVLRDQASKPVIDADWNELLLDVGSADKRSRLAAIVGGWIEGCASAGFDAVEIDNLDSYTRSKGLLKQQDAVAFSALLSAVAHQHGLAIAQKNASDLVALRAQLGTDFVVAEECNRYDECDVYSAGYGKQVLMIEYRRADFQKACTAYPDFSVVLRDLELVTPGQAAYVFEGC